MKTNLPPNCLENKSNSFILHCLGLPIGEFNAEAEAHFNACVTDLNGLPNLRFKFNGNPVFIDPDNGIILAAVCGSSGVAVRVPSYFAGKLILSGARDQLAYVGGKVSLSTQFSGNPDAWLITDSKQNVEDIRRGISAVRSLLSGEQERRDANAAAAKAAAALEIDHPENQTVLAYLKSLKARPGSPSPEYTDYVFHELPKYAQVKFFHKGVEKVDTMVHPESGIIFAFDHNTYLFLRLPEQSLDALLAQSGISNLRIPEAGAGWIRIFAFEKKEQTAPLLSAAYQHATKP